jgi:hypothetical protein
MSTDHTPAGLKPASAQRNLAMRRAPLSDGMCLGGRFRVHTPFLGSSRTGGRFLTCELHDDRRLSIRAYAWEGDCNGFQFPRHGERVFASGRVR